MAFGKLICETGLKLRFQTSFILGVIINCLSINYFMVDVF